MLLLLRVTTGYVQSPTVADRYRARSTVRSIPVTLIALSGWIVSCTTSDTTHARDPLPPGREIGARNIAVSMATREYALVDCSRLFRFLAPDARGRDAAANMLSSAERKYPDSSECVWSDRDVIARFALNTHGGVECEEGPDDVLRCKVLVRPKCVVTFARALSGDRDDLLRRTCPAWLDTDVEPAVGTFRPHDDIGRSGVIGPDYLEAIDIQPVR